MTDRGSAIAAGEQPAPEPHRTSAMHRLFAQQLAAAMRDDHSLDPEALAALVVERYLRGPVDSRSQTALFRAVLENIAQGICLFDEDQRLIDCNQRYAEIYGLKAEHIRPGTTLREIIAQRYLVEGTPTMAPTDYLLWRNEVAAANRPHESVVELQDARVIAVRHQPMPEGGWVATHEDITDRLKIERELAYTARHYAITGLPNRTMIVEQLRDVLNRSSRMAPCRVLSLGLDGIQAIHDMLGQPACDVLLRILSERLRNHLRPADLLGQLGPSEFVIVQCEAPHPTEAIDLAQQLLALMDEPVMLDGQRLIVGVNVGIAAAVKSGMGPEELLHNAGVALHRARADGPGRYRLFEPEWDQSMRARRLLEADLRDAVDSAALELYYQPQFSGTTGKVNGFEALLRWNHPVRGVVPPSIFIPVAEEIGLVSRMGEWALQQACAEAARWPDPIGVSVNISALQLKGPKLPSIVMTALQQSGLSPLRLELEITETSIVVDLSTVATMLEEIRTSGVRIALDDFGTGYSSLSYLPVLPIDKIKIDQSFIAKLEEGPAHEAIVRAIISLSTSLGVTCTAEGVETQAQLAFLKGEHCTEIQGYLLGHPCPASEIPDLLTAWDQPDPDWANTRSDASSFEALATPPLEAPQGISFAQIVDTANDIIIVTDANLDPPGPNILYVNSAFTRLSGYTAQEALGMSPRILQGPGTSRRTLDKIGIALRSGREVQQKVLNYAKCGAPYWLDLRIAPLRYDEGRITQFVSIERDVTLDKRRLDELEYVADRDTLTGIPNRRAFLRVASDELQASRSRRAAGPCVAFIDVDHFKGVNDRFGHATGDAVLFGIADRVAENIRRVDMLGRIGGEEFAVCMPSLALREGTAIGERLCHAVAAEPFDTPTGPLWITVSVGVSEAGQTEHSLSDLMARADRAMYAAKQSGRDQVVADPASQQYPDRTLSDT